MDTTPSITSLAEIWERSLSKPPGLSLSKTRKKLHEQIDELILSDESIDDDMYKISIFKKLWERKLKWSGETENIVNRSPKQLSLLRGQTGSYDDVHMENCVVFNNGTLYKGPHGEGRRLQLWQSDYTYGQASRAYSSLAHFCKSTKPGLLGARLSDSAHVLNIDHDEYYYESTNTPILITSETKFTNHIPTPAKDDDFPTLNAGMYIVRVGKNVQAQILETHDCPTNIFCNQWIYVVDYGGNLVLDRKNLKSSGILDSLHIIQYPGSTVKVNTYDRGDQWRNISITAFQDTHTEINGSTLLKHEDSANFVDIHHKGNDSNSNIVYKSAVYEQHTGNFIGRIQVDKKAINIESNMANKNLLIDANSKAMSKPILNINTKDIKCSHGCTISKVREEDIYYLETLGVSRGQAKNMIASGHIQI